MSGWITSPSGPSMQQVGLQVDRLIGTKARLEGRAVRSNGLQCGLPKSLDIGVRKELLSGDIAAKCITALINLRRIIDKVLVENVSKATAGDAMAGNHVYRLCNIPEAPNLL